MSTKVFTLLMIFLLGCSYQHQKANNSVAPTYQSIQTNILGPKCYQCHGDRLEPDAEPLNSFALLSNKVSPYTPEESPLFLHVATGSMPPDLPLTKRERVAIYIWIRNGAFEN